MLVCILAEGLECWLVIEQFRVAIDFDLDILRKLFKLSQQMHGRFGIVEVRVETGLVSFST